MNWQEFISWLEQHEGTCFYKKYFGIECPGCGFQRSFIELLKGNFFESIKLYPALLPLILMYIFLVLHLIFKFKNGARILLYMFITNVFIIITSYILKILHVIQ